MSDNVDDLIEFAEKKRLLFERIKHKLGELSFNDSNQATLISPLVFLTEKAFTSLYYEAIDTFDVNIMVIDNKVPETFKLKWVGLYTMSLAKESQARCIIGGAVNENIFLEYNNLLSESKEEKKNLIKLLYDFNKG